jgi:hypothetical protein
LEEDEAVRVAVDRPPEEGDLALRRDTFADVGFDAFDRAARACCFAALFALEGRVVLADLDLRCLIAIGDILCVRQHHELPLT